MTLPIIVLDTSVIVKWFRQEEELARLALALRERYLQGQITVAVPMLLIYELANVLRYKSELTTEQVQEAVESLLDMGLEWIEPSVAAMRRAVSLAREGGITVYDATFVAVAETLGAALVTADEQLARRLHSLSYVGHLGQSCQ